ncbi:hypothetical protein BH09PLA1_BH09PLA1_00820 [soil metagenome]
MNEHDPQFESQSGPPFGASGSIDAYLDGQLTGETRERFEAQLDRDPALRDAVAMQRQIDELLKRVFVVGSVDGADATLARLQPGSSNGQLHDARLELPESALSQRRKFVRMPLAIAAAIVFLICGPFVVWNAWEYFQQPKVTLVPRTVKPLDVAYRAEVDSGFHCDWECKSQSEFAAYFATGFGQPLQMKDPPAEVASIGLKYTGGITPYTISYMAKVNGQPVMVFADKLDSDPGQVLANAKGLHIFKRTIGSLVLYEVSPLKEPKLLDLFYQP